MLPRERTITRKVFPRYNDTHVLWNGAVLRIRCYKKTALVEIPRFAVVVSKKQYANVALRNLFKRRVLSVIHAQLPLFDRLRFGRYVIFPKSPVEQVLYRDIAADITSLIAVSL